MSALPVQHEEPAPLHWQRSESRVVRPFKTLEAFLNDSKLRLYREDEFSAIETIQQDTIHKSRLSPQVEVAALPSNVVELVGVEPEDLNLIVSLEEPSFKVTSLAVNRPLKGFAGGPLDLDAEAVAEMNWSSDTKIHVAVVLAKSRPTRIGQAWRAGSWLAKKTFRIGKVKDSSSFEVKQVPPEYFVERRLPATTTYLVEIADPDLNVPSENLPNLLKVCVNKEVFDAMARNEESAAAQAFMKTVFIDVIVTAMATGHRNLQGELLKDGILDVLTQRLSKSSKLSMVKLQQLAREPSGAQLRAVIQAQAGLTQSIVSAIRRRG